MSKYYLAWAISCAVSASLVHEANANDGEPSIKIELAQASGQSADTCEGSGSGSGILRSEGVIERLEKEFIKQQNPLTKISCSLACLPLPYGQQTYRQNSIKLYTWGTLGASITAGHVIATLHDNTAFKYFVQPTYAAAPYSTTMLSVPYFDLATVKHLSISLVGTPDGFKEGIEWSRSYSVARQGDQIYFQPTSPVDAKAAEPEARNCS